MYVVIIKHEIYDIIVSRVQFIWYIWLTFFRHILIYLQCITGECRKSNLNDEYK